VKVTTVILVRHGRTAWNVVERFRGREDVPLDDAGLSQAQRTAERIARRWSPVAIYSSPLSRATATAEAIGRRCRLAVRVHPGLIDIDYGRWQGLTPEEARTRDPRRVRGWYGGAQGAHAPGGEPLAGVRRRCLQAVTEIAAGHPETQVVVVGHTVVNRAILLEALSMGSRQFHHLRQEPCAINVLETDGRAFTLVSMNDTCHLEDHR
jgi:broad specificity phosphatase PhoE